MKKTARSLLNLAVLSGAVIVAQAEEKRVSDAHDGRLAKRDVPAGVDGTDVDASRNAGLVHGKLLQVVNGPGRITAWLDDAEEGKSRILMLADLTPSATALSYLSESGSVFGYLYSAGQPDPHKTKSNLIVIGSYIKNGNSGSFDLAILDRRNTGLTRHVQMLGRIQGRFGQDGHLALLTQSPHSAGGRAFIDPIDAGPLAGDSRDARRGGVQVTKPAAGDGSGPFIDPIDAGPSSDGQRGAVQVTKPAEPMVFVASVVGRWQLN